MMKDINKALSSYIWFNISPLTHSSISICVMLKDKNKRQKKGGSQSVTTKSINIHTINHVTTPPPPQKNS